MSNFMDLCKLGIVELQSLLKNKEVSSVELANSFLARVSQVDSKIHAFLHLDSENILNQARSADQLISRGEFDNKPLLGIPIAIKDVIAVKGERLGCASRILDGFVSPYDATVIEKLKAAGAIVFGRLNMDEFAMGSSTENSAFGPTHNPWAIGYAPGGSSGGSAAAVSALECPAALGSDTGGSIRQPAALCGCVGVKPTYGRVSRFGLVAFASSLDQIGPLTRSSQDAAVLLEVICGWDKRDCTSVNEPVQSFSKNLTGDIKGLKIGLPREYFIKGLDPEVNNAVLDAVKLLEKLGASVLEISLPHTEYAVATYYIIATAEASANLARFDGIRYGLRVDGSDLFELYCKTRGKGFGSEVKRRILLGTYVLSSGYYDAYYLRAQKVRTLIRNDFIEAFKKVDVIVTPTTPTPAFKLGEKSGDPLQMYLSDVFTISCNLAGICGVSIPCGFTAQPKLPIGLQILGKHFDELTILNTAFAFQQATDWHKQFPEI